MRLTLATVASFATILVGASQGSTSAVGGGHRCRARDLDVAYLRQDGAAGTDYVLFSFSHRGRGTCTLRGFPGVTLHTATHRVLAGDFRRGRRGRRIRTVTVGGGRTARFSLSGVFNFDPCRLGNCAQAATPGA